MFRRLVLDPLRCINSQNELAYLQVVQARLKPNRAKFSTSHSHNDSNKSEHTIESKNTLNKAMKAYLERAREHDEFMATQRHEFAVGKRHLANMMGENPETFTQEDVDNAIEYLFPSGLFQKTARPLMKPPEEVFPQRKAAEFDETGRPHHFLFYTGRPNFFQILHNAVQHINDLYKFEDSMMSKGLQPDPNLTLDLSGSQWLEKSALEIKIMETISDREYASFQNVLERLYSLPYSYKVQDFLMEYRKPLISQTKTFDAIVPRIGEDGRQYISVYECRRKRAIGTVTVIMPGTGLVQINNQDIHYFEGVQQREQTGLHRLIGALDRVKFNQFKNSSLTDQGIYHAEANSYLTGSLNFLDDRVQTIRMDNLGFQDNHVHGSRKLARSISANAEPENHPLYLNRSSATVPRWRRQDVDPMVMLEEQYPSDDYDYEYMECGPSPPADHIHNPYYESYEEVPTHDLSVQICHDTIRNNLIEHMKASSGKHHYFDDIESKKIVLENLEESFRSANKFEISICFLWAAFLKRWDLLDGLLKLGAQLKYYEPNQGLSALHLTAFSSCIPGTQFLIARGSDVNAIYKWYSPLHCAAFGDSPETAMILLNNGARVQAHTNSPNYGKESALHCAVRANAVACVRLFTVEGADVGEVEFSGMSPIHLAAELGHPQCLRIMLETKGVNVNARTKEKEQTPLHLAADGGNAECIDILLDKEAEVDVRNYRLQTPLHLASRAQSYESVELLLVKGGADPNIPDCDKRISLHTAVGKSARSYDIIDILIRHNADVNAKDQFGYTPLHMAALNELSQCVEKLLYHGADVTAKSKYGNTALGIIIRKTPASLVMVRQKLDQAITLHRHPESSNREVELKLDFRSILQHCHPREISFLNTFVDEGQKEILLHPLCSAFLYLKWEKIRKYYIARMLFCFIFILSLSLYVLTALAHNCYNHGKNMNDTQPQNVIELCEKKSMMGHMLRNNPFVIEMQWFVLVGITCCEIARKIYGITGYPSIRQYLSHPENIIEWAVIVSVFVISFVYTGRTYTWQNHVGAFAVLFGWTNLMLMVGQLPVFGPYVAMYTRVQKEFAKLLLAYSCLLIGFTISFCVIFPDSSTFANPFIGLITVMVMMTGELSLDLLVDDDPEDPPFLLEISAQVTYIMFLLFVTVILMNLLVGIAVHDIQGLQKTAGLSKLVRQTKLISYIELALFNGYLPQTCLKSLLHWTALVSPKAYRVVLNVKPLNPGEKRLPKDILEAAYEIAKNGPNAWQNSCKMNNNNVMEDLSGLYDFSETATSLAPLHNKVDRNADMIDSLAKEVRDLKLLLSRNLKLLEQCSNVQQQRKNSVRNHQS